MYRSIALQAIALVLAGGLLLPVTADAALSRRAGTTVAQDSFNDTQMLVEDLELTCFQYMGVGNCNYLPIMAGGHVLSQYSLNSYYLGAYATPRSDCWANIQYGDEFGPTGVRTDCDYGFQQGEMLALEGTVDKLLAGSDYELLWTIEGGGRQWQFAGSMDGGVHLNVAMPADMLPGDYLVTLTLTETPPPSSDGHTYSYWGYSNFLDYQCLTVGDNLYSQQYCGYQGRASDLLVFTSNREDLHVFANAVPLPATLPLVATGLLALFGLRRRH